MLDALLRMLINHFIYKGARKLSRALAPRKRGHKHSDWL